MLLAALSVKAESAAPQFDYAFTPQPLGVPVKNPLTGWRGKRGAEEEKAPGVKGASIVTIDPNYETLKKWYIGWNEIEDQEIDDVEKIRRFMDQQWKELPAQNAKAIPRIVLIDAAGSYAPKDLPPFLPIKENYRASVWYSRPEVKARLGRLITRLGKLWDHDSRVAWVEMGVQGKYGEQWDLDQMPEFAFWLSDQFKAAFQNKKVLIRYVGVPAWGKNRSASVKIANDYPFGFYEDSFGKATYECEKNAIAALDHGNRWKIAVMGGETGVVRSKKLMGHGYTADTAATLEQILSGAGLNYLLNWVREVHASHLGFDLTMPVPDGHPGTLALRSALGYHFVITKYSQTAEVAPGGTLHLSFSVKNRGSSPFYYRWPLQVSLVDEKTHRSAFSSILQDVDIRTWLPGTDWNETTGVYQQQAQEIETQAAVKLPANLPVGSYVVALAILDPEGGNLTCVRFEIQNYWQGGLHPMGRVGVGVPNNHPAVDAPTFYTNPVDSTVHYKVLLPP